MDLITLRALVADIKTKADVLHGQTSRLKGFIDMADDRLNDRFSSAINPQIFLDLQAPIYTEILTAIETASDQLGSDILH